MTVQTSRRSTVEKPIGRVRWRLNPISGMTLQQYWSITTQEDGIGIVGMHGEWRDVPIESDDGKTPK